jgi:23S rRNA pseudouridine1911/1915/1917 synthase
LASNKKSTAQTFRLTLPAGVRLDRFLTGALAEKDVKISRTELQRLVENPGNGFISGIPENHLKSSFRAKHDTEITVVLEAKAAPKLIPLDLKILVIYEDKHLAIVHKPAGMTVHPGAGTGPDTLVHVLLARLDKLAPDAESPGIVHRLDRETEGLMIVAKTDEARQALVDQAHQCGAVHPDAAGAGYVGAQ